MFVSFIEFLRIQMPIFFLSTICLSVYVCFLSTRSDAPRELCTIKQHERIKTKKKITIQLHRSGASVLATAKKSVQNKIPFVQNQIKQDNLHIDSCQMVRIFFVRKCKIPKFWWTYGNVSRFIINISLPSKCR